MAISLPGTTGSGFFVVIYYRNHLPIMSLNKVSDSIGKYTIDLSVSGNVYKANNAVDRNEFHQKNTTKTRQVPK